VPDQGHAHGHRDGLQGGDSQRDGL
jgi:hypothetical protein